jgi:filamentous hemagglutinin family protein
MLFKKGASSFLCLVYFAPLLGLVVDFSRQSIAQVVPVQEDATLSSPSTVSDFGSYIEINGGTQKGANLFHSFTKFTSLEGTFTLFNADSSIRNIITRVTGNSVSTIDGGIGIPNAFDYPVNFFLLNPNGVVLGKNAAFDIGGSLLLTTASSIQFSDGESFGVSQPDIPVLTVAVPVGLQFGSSVAPISISGPAHNFYQEDSTNTIFTVDHLPGLQLNTGNTLAIVGGSVEMNGGNLTVFGGNVELGAVKSGYVGLIPTPVGWNLDYSGATEFGDINLAGSASIDVTGAQGGSFRVQGRNLTLTDGSLFLSQTTGEFEGRASLIRATESIRLSGIAPSPPSTTEPGLPSAFISETSITATGKAGNLTIETPILQLSSGTQISNGTYGPGTGGELTIRAQDITVTGSNVRAPSAIINNGGVRSTGNAGSINIQTDTLSLRDNGLISTQNFGKGNGGALTINSNQTLLEGSDVIRRTGTGFFSGADAGNGGRIQLDTGNLTLLAGAQITSFTSSAGQGGDIDITARSIEANGASNTGFSSGIYSTVSKSNATGNAGNIMINTGDLLFDSGGQIGTSTYGIGNAGNITVKADSLRIKGANGTQSSGLFASVLPTATGKGGLISLATNQLEVLDGGRITTDSAGSGAAGNLSLKTSNLLVNSGGQISASTQGSGDAGELSVTADRVQVQGPSSISTAVQSAGATGNAGSLTVQTSGLLIRDGGQITSKTQGIGNAGNLNVMADRILIDGANSTQPSGLFASVTSTATGQGGLLSIAAMKLDVLNGGRITADSAGAGAAGSLTIKAQTIDLAGTSAAGPSALLGTVTGSGDGRDLTVVADRLTVRDGATIAVGNTLTNGTTVTQGSGRVGNLNLDIGSLTLSGGSLSAQSLSGDRGSINIRAKTLNLRYGSQINANALGDATGGNIDIQTQLLFSVLTENSDITANAITNRGGAVRIQTDQLLGLQASSRLSELSDITASSEQGAQFSGLVEIKASDTDLSRSLSKLPTLLAGVEPIRVSCSATAGTLSATGKGGLPVMAEQPIRSGMLWGGSRVGTGVAAAIAPAPTTPRLVQANAWTKDAAGRVQLLAQSAAQLPEAGCLAATP